MNVPVEYKDKQISILKCENLKPLNINLKGWPDLFPVLCVLCAKAEGLSKLSGISHLAFKESNRLNKMAELLKACGIAITTQDNKCSIHGKKIWPKISPFLFDTANDHRMVMAGELLSAFGVPVTIQGKHSVNKSFPEFYSIIEAQYPH